MTSDHTGQTTGGLLGGRSAPGKYATGSGATVGATNSSMGQNSDSDEDEDGVDGQGCRSKTCLGRIGVPEGINERCAGFIGRKVVSTKYDIFCASVSSLMG